MRDQSSADTIRRLIDDLQASLMQAKDDKPFSDGRVDSMTSGATVEYSGSATGSMTHGKRANWKRSGSGDGVDAQPKANVTLGQQRSPGWGVSDETRGVVNPACSGDGGRRLSSSSNADSNNISLTQRLRSILLSLREALFRHAAFLEFLPAPDRVNRRMSIPGAGVDDFGSRGERRPEEEVEPLDPEVTRVGLRLGVISLRRVGGNSNTLLEIWHLTWVGLSLGLSLIGRSGQHPTHCSKHGTILLPGADIDGSIV